MRVVLTKESKKVITVAEMPVVRQMIAELKEDDYTAEKYAAMAARLITGDSSVEIISATAEIARNCRIYNGYGEESGDLDVWIDFRAFSNYKSCFIIAGAYLSDIWQIGGENNEELIKQMYVRKFSEEAPF